MQTMNSIMQNSSAFQLKGSLLTFTLMQLLHTNVQAFASQLETLVKQTPNFFKHAPVVIDLEKLLDCNDSIDFVRIKAELVKHGLIPVGIRNANDQQVHAAIAAGLGILSSTKVELGKISTTPEKNNNSKIILQPVRSGQQVYAQHGDLIILASVSPGAELMSDGHIHVYGTLRGRALAGVAGNIQARIFCNKLEAELISIAGYYKLADDIKTPKSSQGVQVFLEGERLNVCAI
jgi:septum site-determining protein MinC